MSNTAPATYHVRGMHCAGCAANIERRLRKLPGIAQADVAFAAETLQVLPATMSLAAMNAELTPLGFTLELQGDGQEASLAELAQLRRHVRMAVPITVLSTAVMAWEMSSAHTGVAVQVLMLLLASYMLLVVGRMYLRGVWQFIRHGQATMDTLIGIGTSVAYFYSLLVTFCGENFAEYVDPKTTYYDVTVMVIGLITLGKYLEAKARRKTGNALHALLSLQAKTAMVERDGKRIEIPLAEVKLGDVLLVLPGAQVPVDGVVLSGHSSIDESMLTGESAAIAKAVGDAVLGGTINQDGQLRLQATAVGKNSALAKIVAMVKTAQSSRAPIQKLADQISAIFVPAVLLISVLTVAVWVLWGGKFMPLHEAIAHGITGAIGVLVIACPCALGLATPTALIVGIGKGARRGILVKNAQALERLSQVTDIVFDKTGTLTAGKPKVLSMTAMGMEEAELIRIAAGLEATSGHPLAHAILELAKARGLALPAVEDFSNTRGLGVKGTIDGVRYAISSDRFIAQIAQVDPAMWAQETFRTATPVLLATADKLLGYFFIGDEIKPTAAAALAGLRARHINTHMATGDHEAAAKAVAAAVGIDRPHARMLPEDKHKLVEALKAAGAIVAVAGDGVNDAPALAAADVGIAMATGTDIAIETADITLLHGDISKIGEAHTLARQTLMTIRQNLFWAFAFNICGIPLAAGAFYPWGITLNPMIAGATMAFSSVVVVSNSLRLGWKKL